MKKIITTLAAVAALGVVAAPAQASTSCRLYNVPITNIRTNVGCGTADAIAQVEYWNLRHWVQPHFGAPYFHVTWRTVYGRYVNSLAFTARYGGMWATFLIGP